MSDAERRDRWLRVAAEVVFPAGVAALVWPRLAGDLGSVAGLFYVAFVVVTLAAAGPFLGSAFRSALRQGETPWLGKGGLRLSIQLFAIGLGTAIGQSGAIAGIAVPVTVVGIVLVVVAATRAARPAA
jgi:hypothetical protein